MKLVVLGATGGTGIEFVRESLKRGHAVTALVRNPARLSEFQGRIRVEEGNLLDRGALAKVLENHNAVLSGFGPRVPIAKSDAHLLEQFAAALTGAIEDARVRRLVIISTAFLFKDSIVPPTYLLGKLLFPSVVTDSAALEETVQESSAEWTIVRPPQLTDGPMTGTYRERIGHLPRLGFKISRADVAHYFVKAIEKSDVVRKIVGISK
jgi:putative NADH-flavin reductase